MPDQEDAGETPVEASGFVYRRFAPKDAGARSIVALHGSGVDETTVLPLARAICPEATVIAPRGRIDQNGERRWFRKLTPTSFDQTSINEEAAAFAAFLDGLRRDGVVGGVERTLVIGYSNGGNLAHSVMFLHPGRIGKLALLRCMPVLKRTPMVDLSGSSVLVVGGATDDTYGLHAGKLASLLNRRGATTRYVTVSAGHMFGDADIALIRAWLEPARSDA